MKGTANLTVLDDTATDLESFAKHLAAYCNQYVIEIAEVVMAQTKELYEDKAIVLLVEKWYEADTQYTERREKYLVDSYQYVVGLSEYKPTNLHEFVGRERNTYKSALYELLIH